MIYRTCLFIVVFSALVFSASAKPPINKDAQAVARVLPKASFKKGDVSKAQSDLQRVLTQLGKTNRNSRSSLDSLMSKAGDFRSDIGPSERALSFNAILNAWEAAEATGALDESYHFIGRATRGRYAGQWLVFENIVPPEVAPEFAGYVGNIRIVPKDRARKKGDALSERDQNYLTQLNRVKREHDSRIKMMALRKKKPIALPKRQTDSVGIGKEEAEARYLAAVKAAGDAVNQMPTLRLVGQRISTPSKMNGNRYRVRFEVTNLSRHPTEIVVHYKIVGYTDNGNLLYLMKKVTQTLRLRASESREIEVWTDSVSKYAGKLKKFDPKKSTKVIYRGYTIEANFGNQTAATAGSDGRLAGIASGAKPAAIPTL